MHRLTLRSSRRALSLRSHNSELERLEQDICANNNGRPLNVKSPKQVSLAIFGTVQSTSRDILLQASQGKGVSHERQQTLAKLVLQHRALSRRTAFQQRQQPFSSLATEDALIQEEEVLNHGRVKKQTTRRSESARVKKEATKTSNAVKTISSTVPTSSPVTTRHSDVSGASYVNSVEALFSSRSKLNDYWKEPLLLVTKPSARHMVLQLSTGCPMGYDPTALSLSSSSTSGKKGTLLEYIRQQKQRYPDCIILTRVGEFYETYGVDAVMLVEHCGLNAMAGKARAGCPIRNIQATLDCLTVQGFRVAVYEEAADIASKKSSRIKNRILAQIVSTASPTYLYDLVLQGNADALVATPASRPYVGVLESAKAGYTVVEVSMEARTVRISERLTPEAVACRLAAYPPADPLVYVPASTEYSTTSLPFLPSTRLRVKVLSPSLVEEPVRGVSDVERAQRTIVGALLQMMEQQEDDQERSLSPNDFMLIANADDKDGTHTNPLYVETATQLGLMHDRTIPSLVSYLLPETAPAATRHFVRRWLLTPPPPTVADAMSSLVAFLKDRGPALPPLSIPPVGKVLAMLRAGQASAQVYGELLGAMDATMQILKYMDDELIDPLMELLEYESGMAADPDSLESRCAAAMETIEDVISPIHHAGVVHHAVEDQISDYGNLIPCAFFERNESPWRGRVRSSAALESYKRVHSTAERLAKAVVVDFWGARMGQFKVTSDKKSPIVQDIFNNIFAIKEIPSWAKQETDEDGKSKYFHPRDRNGKILRNRYTTVNVQSALADYVAACDFACQEVTSVLTRLSQTLCESGHLPAVVQAAHLNLILSTTSHHAANANALGWNTAITYESGQVAGHFQDVWPYWMDRSEAVSNSFDVDGIFLLTAPNMSGKSTIMRSTAAAALLANCGLCAPVGPNTTVRRFDNIFVRGASADVPTEGKSAFGAEMGDIAALLRSCGDKSLVFVDELGRGTSPKDGTCLAGAVLEAMAQAGMSGVFATHLHGVLKLPLNGRERISMKRMEIREDVNGESGTEYAWTYKLQDGMCTNSLALVTAARFGLPDKILARAEFFGTCSQDNPIPTVSDEEPTTFTDKVNGVGRGLKQAMRVAEAVVGQEGVAIRIPPRWSAPSALEGRSCVYILELDDDPSSYYVGETDSLHRRLSQHRSKGGAWTQLTAAALPVDGGKAQARHVESLVIRKLSKAGFALESVMDGRKVRRANDPGQ